MIVRPTLINKRYILHDLLGQGGMGAVYRVTDRLNGQFVALKQVTILSQQLANTPSTDNDFRLALSDEFRTLASLRHPNIIGVLDYGFEGDQPYFTMELLQEPRTILLASKDASINEQIQLIVQLLQALVYLHRRGVLHRDLKPGNILVARDGITKVLDFGLSLAGAYSRSNVQQNTAGTLAYMAPELFSDEPASVATDLYAVGVIAYEILTGHHPFNQKNVALLINSILSAPPDILGIEPKLASIVARLLAKDPSERYAEATHVIQALYEANGQAPPSESIAIRESFLQAAKFVGRDEELKKLKTALDEIASAPNNQDARAWLIGGESGVGKSRLLDELRIRALVRGALVLRGQAITEGSIPYQIWREPLRRLVLSIDLNDDDAAVLKTIIPDIETLLERHIPDALVLEPQLSQNRFMRVVTDIFRSLQQATIIILEDLQWANSENLELLHRIIPLTLEAPLLLIASYRDDERPELRETLGKMQLLKLKRLDQLSIGELSESMLGDIGRHPEIIALLQNETEGNVFFVVEILRALAEHVGQLNLINHAGLTKKLVPVGIQNIVQSRLNRVPEDARSLLRLAALAGRELDLDLLRSFTMDLDTWLEQCSASSVIEFEQTRWRFAHDKLREGIISKLDDSDLPSLHQQLAQKLELVHPNDPVYIPAIARHYQQANIHDKAAHYLTEAGNFARQGFANHEAIAFYQSALDSLKFVTRETDASWGKLEISLYENIGDLLELIGQHEEARQTLSTAMSLVSPDEIVHCARLQRKIGKTQMNQRIYPRAMETFILAINTLEKQSIPDDPSWQHEWIETQLECITCYYWLNQAQEMQDLANMVKPFLERYATIAQRRLFAVTIALSALRRGRFTITDAAMSQMDANLPVSDDNDWGRNINDSFSRFGVGFLHLWHGDFDEAEFHLQKSLADSEHLGDVTTLSRALAYLTVIRRKKGQIEEVRQYAERLLTTASMGQMIEYISSAQGHQAWLALRDGNTSLAMSQAQEGFQQMQSVPIGKVIAWITLWPLISAEIANGQIGGAIDHVRFLLGPTQQPQPEDVQTELQIALQKWEEGNADSSTQHLIQACQLARQYGYV